MSISLSFRGRTYTVDIPFSSPISGLTEQLEVLTGVPQSNQKLVWKGRKATSSDSTLEEAGLKPGVKVMLLGTTASELDTLKFTEAEVQRRDAIMARRVASGPSKVRPFAYNPELRCSNRFALPGPIHWFFKRCTAAVPLSSH